MRSEKIPDFDLSTRSVLSMADRKLSLSAFNYKTILLQLRFQLDTRNPIVMELGTISRSNVLSTANEWTTNVIYIVAKNKGHIELMKYL